MNVFAEFALAMAFPVASVGLGGWLLWRRARAKAEAKRIAELAAQPLVTRRFQPAYLRHRPMARIVTTEDDIAALEKLQAAFKQAGVEGYDVHSVDSMLRSGALLDGFPESPHWRIAPFVTHGTETSAPKRLRKARAAARNLAMDIDIAVRIEIRRLKRWWKRRGAR
ncbi:MAG: hypothetical protein ACRC6L_12950 [Steroidobacteraceae bacterium]